MTIRNYTRFFIRFINKRAWENPGPVILQEIAIFEAWAGKPVVGLFRSASRPRNRLRCGSSLPTFTRHQVGQQFLTDSVPLEKDFAGNVLPHTLIPPRLFISSGKEKPARMPPCLHVRYSFVPQSLQNFSPGCISLPQLGQCFASG